MKNEFMMQPAASVFSQTSLEIGYDLPPNTDILKENGCRNDNCFYSCNSYKSLRHDISKFSRHGSLIIFFVFITTLLLLRIHTKIIQLATFKLITIS